MSGPRILCLGMNAESLRALDMLGAAGAEIAAVAGLPAAASAGVSDYADLSAWAGARGLPFLPVTDANAPEARAALAGAGADVLFVLGWSQLLAPETFGLFAQGAIGSHPSRLPHGRGRAPVPWTILEDLRESAVTLFRIGRGVDDGAIVKQLGFAIPPRAYAGELYAIVAETLGRAFVELLAELAAGTVRAVPQTGKATWRARRTPMDGAIDFARPAEWIDRLVRAVSRPYPGAYTHFEGRRVIFWRAEPETGADAHRKGAPGQVLRRAGGLVLVQAGEGSLWLGEAEFPEDAPVPFPVGARFGYAVADEIHALRRRVAALEDLAARLAGAGAREKR